MKVLAFALLPMLFGAVLAADAPRQASCGQFSGDICFSLNGDGTWTHKVIIDFSIDEIQLGNTAHITIYEGVGLSEQEGVGTTSTARTYQTASGTIEIVVGSKPKPRYFDVHYKRKSGWGVVQVFGYVSDEAQAQALADFMASIHPCTRNNLSISCSADAPFADAAGFIRDILKVHP